MREAMIISLVLIIGGLLSMILAIRFLVSKTFAEKYIRTSHEVWLLCTILGEEKVYQITKIFFAPLGILISFVCMAFGIYIFITLLVR